MNGTCARGRTTHVVFGDTTLRAGAADGPQIDAELVREPPDERRRPDPSVSRPVPGDRFGSVGCSGSSVVAEPSPITTITAPDRHDVALRGEDARDDPGRRGRDLDRRLVGLDLHERVVLRDLLTFGDEPTCDLAFGQALAEVGQLELVGHARRFYRIASSRSTACTPLTPFTIWVTRRSTTTLESASA